MSAELLGEVWRLPLSTTEKLIMAYLADGACHHGTVPPIETKDLAEIIDRSPKTTRTALKHLTDVGHLDRASSEGWRLVMYPDVETGRLGDDAQSTDIGPEDTVSLESPTYTVPEQTAPAPAQTEPPSFADTPTTRLERFCRAWGLTSPSDNLVNEWDALEAAEAKHNKRTKHTAEDGRTWTETAESIADLMPCIEHAVRVFQARAAAELPNHADGPAAFIDRELWLAPEYQVALDTVDMPEEEIDIDAIDEMVGEMNRAGGHFACHFLTTSRNPHTGEMETETPQIYARRVQGKYDQYLAMKEFFTE